MSRDAMDNRVPEKNRFLLNSIEAAKMLGVNVSTVKRWTDEGKLNCHKTAGGHRKFSMQHLIEFVERHADANPQVSVFPLLAEDEPSLSYHIVRGNFDFLAHKVLDFVLEGRTESVQQILHALYLAQHPLYLIYDQLMTPVMHQLGAMWIAGELGVAEEHLATQSLRDCLIRLQGLLQPPHVKIGKAMLVNLSSELHDMALKMIGHVLEQRGFQILFSGQITPTVDAERTLEKYRPDRLYISITFIADAKKTRDELEKWCHFCEKYSVRVFVGGQGFPRLHFEHPVIEPPLQSFAEIHKI
ncbi:helix-turn-helix domain-containing protein [candidate division KSB1 bacterium]|nr:helix-turn-helix domain-containing protein [candidate division KSB1 bacterium]